MRALLFAVALAVSGSLAAAAEQGEDYQVVHGWPRLPEGAEFGGGAGVGVSSSGEVYYFHRTGRVWKEPLPTDAITEPTIAVIDAESGQLVRQMGAGLFAMPHGLTVDDLGNVWLTDVALNQVFKLSREGKVLMTLGERGVAGADAKHFNRPTDVAVLPDGSFYVGDGYRNTRIIKYSADGKFLFQWGAPGQGPGKFKIPHALVVSGGKIFVADRENGRVQVFDLQGKFIEQWPSPQPGRLFSLAALPHRRFVVIVNDGGQGTPAPERATLIVVDEHGKPLGRFGRAGSYDGEFRGAHDVATDRRGDIFVVDVTGQRVQKFALGR